MVRCCLVKSSQKLTPSWYENFFERSSKVTLVHPTHFFTNQISIQTTLSGTKKAIKTKPTPILHFIYVVIKSVKAKIPILIFTDNPTFNRRATYVCAAIDLYLRLCLPPYVPISSISVWVCLVIYPPLHLQQSTLRRPV